MSNSGSAFCGADRSTHACRRVIATFLVAGMICGTSHAASTEAVQGAVGASAPGEGTTAEAPHASREALRGLLDEAYDLWAQANPEAASRRGDLRFNDRLTDLSPEAIAERLARTRSLLERLERVGVDELDEAGRLDADLLRRELETTLAMSAFRPEQTPISSLWGPHIELPQLALMVPVRTEREVADYVTRLEGVGVLVDQHIANMRAGMEAGRVVPRVTLVRAAGVAAGLADAGVERDPTTSAFYGPLRGRNDALSERARRAIAGTIVPAFRRLAEFLEREYVPAARETIGASESKDGRAMYDAMLRYHTTTSLSAPEIHEIGLAEVARLRGEMLRVIEETDWARGPGRVEPTGSEPPDERLARFIAFLRAEPRFRFAARVRVGEVEVSGAEAMLERYRAICKQVDPELTRLFGVLPRLSYGVGEIPRFAAASSPAAYYYPGSLRAGVPGMFMVNTHDLSRRPRYSMISLALHEAVPGHHLQSALASELAEGDGAPGENAGRVHAFRSLINPTAYVEGWALYAEGLGLEMGEQARAAHRPEGRGLYADPYDYFGRLSDEIWRASRLVVDTGIHAMGWSRARAIEYLLANTAGTESDMTSEVDRYIGWPGQACAYKIGELRILALRREAEAALGERMDLRAFHDQLLGAGALPLDVLEARMRRWIASSRP